MHSNSPKHSIRSILIRYVLLSPRRQLHPDAPGMCARLATSGESCGYELGMKAIEADVEAAIAYGDGGVRKKYVRDCLSLVSRFMNASDVFGRQTNTPRLSSVAIPSFDLL